MTAAFTLRLAEPHEAGLVRDFTRAAYAAWVPVIGREPLPMTVDYDAALRTNRFDLLQGDGELVGLIETVADGNLLLVVNVAVRPDREGQGLGRRLLAHAEMLAKDQGLQGLRLYTNQRFERNIRLYQAIGYAIDREEEGPRGVTVYMSKRL